MALGRLITGVGVGASSQIVPLYLSEVSPPELRGTVNGVRRVAHVLGCLLAFQFAVPLQRPVATDVEETRGRVVHADRAAPGLSKNAEDANEAAAKAPVAKAPVAADAANRAEILVAAKPSGEPSSAYTVDANVRGESSVAVASPNASKSSQVSGTADPTSIVAVKSTKPSGGGLDRGGDFGRGGGLSCGGSLGRFGSSAASAATADRVSEGRARRRRRYPRNRQPERRRGPRRRRLLPRAPTRGSRCTKVKRRSRRRPRSRRTLRRTRRRPRRRRRRRTR